MIFERDMFNVIVASHSLRYWSNVHEQMLSEEEIQTAVQYEIILHPLGSDDKLRSHHSRLVCCFLSRGVQTNHTKAYSNTLFQ